MIQIYKIINICDKAQSDKYLNFNDNITRGHRYKLVVPRTKSLKKEFVSHSVHGLLEST